MTTRPSLPRVVQTPIVKAFEALSALRGGRVFHPAGEVYRGELKIWPGATKINAELLQDAGPHQAIVRLSRGIGLPEPLPDVLGLGLKLPGIYGPGRDQDFLFATCLTDGPGRLVLAPAAGFLGRTYSTVLPYHVQHGNVVFGLLPDRSADVAAARMDDTEQAAEDGLLRYRFAVSSPFGRWTPVGVLYLHEAVPDADITFNPWTSGYGIRPAGLLNALRGPVYRESQQARDAEDDAEAVAEAVTDIRTKVRATR